MENIHIPQWVFEWKNNSFDRVYDYARRRFGGTDEEIAKAVEEGEKFYGITLSRKRDRKKNLFRYKNS